MRITLTLLTLFLLFTSLHAERLALLIGIGNYPSNSGWKPLASINDLDHISQALKIQGFKSSNIIRLENEKATRQGILNSFDFLVEKIEKGDIVFIHFSGHGQQVLDDGKDEIDRLDEAIVPYDSPKKFQPEVNEGQWLIRDDELNAITRQLRKKAGKNGQVVFVIDACHSGTGTRGLKSSYRGTATLMAPADFKRKEKQAAIEPSMQINSNLDSKKLAPLACYFASSANENNKESRDDQFQRIGSLSYAVSKILSQNEQLQTFEEFFERIKIRMKILSPKQHPQWEGPNDQKLFLNQSTANSNSLFSISKKIDDQNLVAEVGTLSGVYEGSQIEIFSLDKQQSVATGIVAKAGLAASIIALNQPLVAGFDELLKLRITIKAQAEINVTIGFDMPSDNLKNALSKYQFIKSSEANPELLLSVNHQNELVLENQYGTVLSKEKYSNDTAEDSIYELLQSIKTYTQAKYLRGFHNENSDFRFSMEILEANCKTPASNVRKLNPIKKNQIKVGTCIQLAIKNNGEREGYFSVIDIQPNNLLNILIPVPNTEHRPSDFFLKPGQTYLTDYTMTIGEPIGEETLKLICTDKPLRLNKIIRKRGRKFRGDNNMHPFEKILSASFLNEETRGSNESMGGTDVGVRTTFFMIIK